MKLSTIVTCPNCKMQVLPKADGTCPSCQSIISQKEMGVISKPNKSIVDGEERTLIQEPSPVTKIKSTTRDVDSRKVARSSAPTKMFGGNQELSDYILKAPGIGRKGLNIMCFIGVFIFGWLLATAFDMLGKKNQGWFYVVPIIVCIAISRVAESALWLVAILIYIIGWIHANIVLSGYQSNARYRISQINRLSGDQLTIDTILEKGILQQKVLANGETATLTLVKALHMSGGNAQLLNMAGVTLFAVNRYPEAKQFFGRALSSVNDDALMKQIKINLINVEKKLK